MNKADGDNVPRAERAAAEYRGALRLFRHVSANWDPPVLTASGLQGEGMDQVWATVEEHRSRLGETGELAARRREQQQAWLWSMLRDGLEEHFRARTDVRRLLPELEAEVAERAHHAHRGGAPATRRLLADGAPPSRAR